MRYLCFTLALASLSFASQGNGFSQQKPIHPDVLDELEKQILFSENMELKLSLTISPYVDWFKRRVKPANIRESGNSIFVSQEDLAALRVIALTRNADAVEALIPFLGVTFYSFADGSGSPKLKGGGLLADNALKASGLPAVDHILTLASESKLDKTKSKAARHLCVDILGEDGLRARVQFLKLGDNPKVKVFVDEK
jgi:hypothetical protein